MKYYICYALEDYKKALYIKDLLNNQDVGFVDFVEDRYEVDILKKVKEEIDSSDVFVILYSFSFPQSLVCNLQLVYVAKTAKQVLCIPIDSSHPDITFGKEFANNNFKVISNKNYRTSIQQILNNQF